MHLISTGKAAERLGVSDDTIRAYVDKGLLSSVTLPSGHKRVDAGEIDRLRQARRVVAPNVAVIEGA